MTAHSTDDALVIRPSALGWFGVLGNREGVRFVTFGHASEAEVHGRVFEENCIVGDEAPPETLTRAADAIERYLAGEPVDLNAIPLLLGTKTPFQRRVIEALRRVGHGQTVSYAGLAEQAGSPRAARAVGTVMSSNRLPLLVPCHRVVGAGNRLGGFSAPQGVRMKQTLLDLEQGRAAQGALELCGV